MIKKFSLFILLSFLFCPITQGQDAKVILKGKVVAYIEPNVDVASHSFVPKSDVLIVQLKRSRRTKSEFIKIVAEYFSEKSPLSEDVFRGEAHSFKVLRRPDCDSFLIPNHSERQNAIERKEGETWTFETPSLKFVKSDKSGNVPKDKVLPCYTFISGEKL